MRNTKALFLALLLVGQCWATCSTVQTPSNTTCSSAATACNVTVFATGANNAVVCGIRSGAASITSTLCSDGTSTYTHATNGAASDATAGISTDVDYTLAVAGGKTTITCNRSASGSAWQCLIWEVSCSGTMVYDNSNNVDDSTSTNPQNGVALTLSGTNDFIAQVIASSATVSSVGAPYALLNGAGTAKMAGALNTTSGTAPSFTLGATGRAAVSAVAIKDNQPPAGTGKNPTLMLLGVGE